MSSSVIEILKDLNEFCASEDLTLNTLKEKFEGYFLAHLNSEGHYVIQLFKQHRDEYQRHPFLHTICMNKNVTFEMVQYILYVVPGAAEASTHVFCPETERGRGDESSNKAYALHCACYNPSCPTSVIELLLERYPLALEQLCLVEDGVNSGKYDGIYVRGLPLHYYLSRTSNADLDAVKILVEALPGSLVFTEQEDFECYPIHVLLSNPYIRDEMLELLQFFIETEPSSIRLLDGYQRTPLHIVLRNGGMTLDVVKFLLNAWPEAIRAGDINGGLPFYMLCGNAELEEKIWFDIFQHLIEIDPTIVRERLDDGELPIHYAASNLSPTRCKVLIDIYPEPVREKLGGYNYLPIHEACANGRLDTIEYLLRLYPESIHTRDGMGFLPFHRAAACQPGAESRVGIIELLLKHDSDAASKRTSNEDRRLPLHLACDAYYGQLDTVQSLFDAYPEAIFIREGGGRIGDDSRRTPFDLARGRDDESYIMKFLQAQLDHAQMGEDLLALTTLDEIGWLPLHQALKKKVPLGSIKFLVRGNPSALRVITNIGALPIHIACHFSSEKVVKYLVDLDGERTLQYTDMYKDSPLHYACQGGNCEVVKYLLANHASLVASAEINDNGELPLHLLCKAGKYKVDKDDSTEYVEIIWRMLLADPEAVVGA